MLELNSIWLVKFLFVPAALLGLLLIGVVSIFNPFSLTVIGATIGLYILIQKIKLIDKLLTSDQEHARFLRVAMISIGHILNWLSLFCSKRALTQTDVYQPIEKAGFPFIVFYYPQPPMGGDVPPPQMWLPFFLSLFFWMAISYALLYALKHTSLIKSKKLAMTVIAFGLVVTLIGFGYTVMKFD